ncbi:MAG: hypothetical protein JWP65_965, partial [Ramlibacter sp.]|uniref:transglutaminase family protein n=1 Tax=Ramlibacter sp. TaxID=1917967 RepID=UPI00262F9AF7
MSIHAALNHVTHYKYDRPVNLGPQVVRLRPAPHCRSKIISYSLRVEPTNHFINWQQDPFANFQARLVFPEPATQFKVTVDLVVEMAVYNPFDFFLEPSADNFPFRYDPGVAEELVPYLHCEPLTPLVAAYLEKIDRKPRPTIDFLVALNQQVQADVRYLIRMEPGVQTPEQTLQLASGSCRDSGWLLVQLLRRLGLAARFVSGYLIQLKSDVKALDGPSGTEIDFTDLHAWCEVYLPGAGWIGLDPTSGLLAGEGHIPLACTPQPSGAAPIEGLMDEAEVEFSHHMQVTRIHESPRVTKPYTEAQWGDVLRLGDKVDRQPRRIIDFLVALNQQVQGDVRYLIRMEPGVQTPEQTLQNASGSSRDSGWLLVQLMRNLGLAARFVSGYLIQLTPDVKALDGPSGTTVDFTDLHAWCEVFLPGAGWIGLDATSGLFAGEGHIPLACTPQPSSAAPIEGGVDKAEVEFAHHMKVTRLY